MGVKIMTVMRNFRVCDSCAVVVVNGDDTHLDDETAAEVSASMDAISSALKCAISGVADGQPSIMARCCLCGYDEIVDKALVIEEL
jgi:hypothetical protein